MYFKYLVLLVLSHHSTTNTRIPGYLLFCRKGTFSGGYRISFSRSAVVGYYRAFPYLVIPIDTHWFIYSRCFSNHQTYIGKNRFNSMNHVGHVLNDYFNRSNPRDDDAKL